VRYRTPTGVELATVRFQTTANAIERPGDVPPCHARIAPSNDTLPIWTAGRNA